MALIPNTTYTYIKSRRIDSTQKWDTAIGGCFVIPVNSGDIVAFTTLLQIRCAFVSAFDAATIVDGEAVANVLLFKSYTTIGASDTLTAPEGSKYLLFTSSSGSSTSKLLDFASAFTINGIDALYIDDEPEPELIPNTSFERIRWRIDSSQKWSKGSTAVGFVIPVNSGDIVAFTTLLQIRCAFVSAFDPATIVKGEAVANNLLFKSYSTIGTSDTLTAPEGSAYLIFTTSQGSYSSLLLNLSSPFTINGEDILYVHAADKTLLEQAISEATLNLESVSVSTNGSDILPANKWVTQSVYDTYSTAITTAQTIMNKLDATQTEIDNAVLALSAATTAFNSAKANGLKEDIQPGDYKAPDLPLTGSLGLKKGLNINLIEDLELVKMGIPLIRSSLTERDSIPNEIRLVNGKYARCQIEDKTYKLDGGVENSNWVEVSTGLNRADVEEAVNEVVDKLYDNVPVTTYEYVRWRLNNSKQWQKNGGCFVIPINEFDELTIINEVQIRCAFVSDFDVNAIVENEVVTNLLAYVTKSTPKTTTILTAPAGSKYLLFTSASGSNGSVLEHFASTFTVNGEDILYEKKSKLDSVYTVNSTDILLLNDPFYMKNALIQSRGYRTGNADTPGVANPNITLLHCSDFHGHKTNMLRLIQFYNYYSSYINDVIHTGDAMQSRFDNSEFVWNFEGTEKILNVIGNHDSATKTGTDPVDWSGATEQQCYDRFLAPYIANWGVEAIAGKCYYYKDYAGSNLRLIVLDDMHWNTEQQTWFQTVLADSKTKERHVICAKHYSNGSLSEKVEGCTFSDAELNASGTSHGTTYVDTFITDGGKFVCWLVGHYHGCDFGTNKGNTNQLILVAPTLSVNRSPSPIERFVGTKSQDAFYLVTIDTDNSWLKVIMVGADIDRTMRSRKMMCYDYANKKLISCV